MISNIFSTLFRFLLLLFVQVLVLNKLEIPYLFTPFIYPLFLIRMPIETSRWLLITVAFSGGLTVDMFCDSHGIHAAACVLMAYSRQGVFYLFRPAGDYEPSHKPTIGVMGTRWFVSVTVMLVFIHHAYFYLLTIFSFGLFFHLFFKVMITTAISILLIILLELFFYRKKNRSVTG